MSPAMMPSCTALSVNSTFSGATVLITGLSRESTGIPLSSTASVILHPNLSVENAIDNGPAGVTGFVGSTVLEQLLRVCPAVSRIYLMVRSKRGMTGQIVSLLFPTNTFQNYRCGCERFTSTPQCVCKRRVLRRTC